jgi:hypothetical protein
MKNRERTAVTLLVVFGGLAHIAALLALCVGGPTVASVDEWLARRRLAPATGSTPGSSRYR